MINVIKLSILCLYLVCLECLPTTNKYARQIPSDDALKFMKKYGYLVDDNGQSEAIYSEENLSNIIKTMQKFGAIEQTGVIDNRTVELMASLRCGVPDIVSRRKKRYAVLDGWNKRHITYYISNWSSKLGEEVVARNIQRALDVWGGYGRLTFSRSYSQDADIIVAFGRGYHGDRFPFDGPGLVLAHAFFPSGTDRPDSAGDIHFDDDESWVDLSSGKTEQDGTDFFTVAIHELGHSLGLQHSSVETSVMFPYYKGYDKDTTNLLDYDDILGMYSLYIQRRLKGDDATPATYPDQQSSTTVLPYTPSGTPARPEYTTGRDREETTRTTRRTTPRYHDREQTTPTPRRKYHWFGPRHPRPTEHPHHHHTTTQRHEVKYDGDDESVDRHKEHDPHKTNPENSSPSLPYICHGHFDAVATLRQELFIFKDEYLWRLNDKSIMVPGYPTPIRQMFPKLPKSVKKVDAAYQRPDGNIVLFTGNKLWIFNGFEFIENSPLPLSYYDLPDYLDGIDAVQTWSKNGKTYFYKRDRFWRYNETSKSMDPGYPMDMSRWRGVPTDLDAATTWKDGITYFFKGDLFWKFDNNWIITTETSPLPIAPIWLGCQEEAFQMKRLFGA
ncbi:unnamed protein product [Ceutorhynchus assimilis]|uniref:Peptidase metallopeptidase domain-containing protein n=1 Tax=Ceutorhynchus assimilis TaxID=467358 RepID=A0A9N9ME79_9CUCU|nr:unnamed protein product [Ceutorhynchus assimilis]